MHECFLLRPLGVLGELCGEFPPVSQIGQNHTEIPAKILAEIDVRLITFKFGTHLCKNTRRDTRSRHGHEKSRSVPKMRHPEAHSAQKAGSRTPPTRKFKAHQTGVKSAPNCPFWRAKQAQMARLRTHFYCLCCPFRHFTRANRKNTIGTSLCAKKWPRATGSRP